MNNRKKIVAAICVGQGVLLANGFLQGHRVAHNLQIQQRIGYGSIKTANEPVVVEGNLITGRSPEDAAAFAQALVDALRKS